MLTFYLRENGVKVKLVRIRSGRTIASLLYRFFVRINSNLIEKGGDGRVIRMKIIHNKLDEQIWSWLEFMSMLPWLILRVYIPLLVGKTVIAERYILDTVTTIAYFINDINFLNGRISRLFFYFIPKNTVFIFLDSDFETVFRRRAGLFNVKNSNPQRRAYGLIPKSAVEPKEFIDFQRKAYKILAKSFGAFEIDTSTSSIDE